ncbi:MAG: YciI family protein, partial [Burkholderiaceae bacterium]
SASAASRSVVAQTPGSAVPPVADSPLFAVEIRTGPTWDSSKKPQEQLHFREHSANLKRLRDEGHLLVGARYSDKGLLVMAGATEAEVRAQMDVDPSIQSQVFAYDIHPFRVFYPGCIGAPKARS